MPGAAGQVPTVALSAQAFQTDRQKAFEAGFDDHLAKPIRPSALNDLLERVEQGLVGRQTAVAPVAAVPAAIWDSHPDEHDPLGELESLCTPDVFRPLLEAAADNIREEAERIAQARAAQDWPAVRRAAHKLAGILGQYHGLKAARMASAVETAAEADISLRLNELAGVIDAVLASLSARLIRLAA